MLGLNLATAYAASLSSGAAFTPAQLFAGGAKGVWLDPSDLSTMFQDTTGTTPVTTAGQKVARINDKSGNGANAIQATAANQPTYQVDGSGRPYLAFAGTSVQLISTFDLSAQNKATVSLAAAVTAAAGFNGLYQYGATAAGALWCYGNGTGINQKAQGASGAGGADYAAQTASATNVVLTSAFDLSSGTTNAAATLRKNAAAQSGGTAGVAPGGGNFQNSTLSIGQAAGVFLTGSLYGLVLVGGALASPAKLETYLGSKVGLTL